MKSLILLALCFFCHLPCKAQVKHIHTIDEFTVINNKFSEKHDSVIVWGTFLEWSKSGVLTQSDERKALPLKIANNITTALDIHLFDSIYCSYKVDDLSVKNLPQFNNGERIELMLVSYLCKSCHPARKIWLVSKLME